MKLFHKNTSNLHIKIGKNTINFLHLIPLLEYDIHDVFSFYYYENDIKEYLLNNGIIELESDFVIDNTEWYLFKDYGKFQKLKSKIEIKFNTEETKLNRDFKLCELNLDK